MKVKPKLSNADKVMVLFVKKANDKLTEAMALVDKYVAEGKQPGRAMADALEAVGRNK